MSGHSKWSTIKHKKGAADAKRGKIFTKHAKLIEIAAHEGGGADPSMNSALANAIENAKMDNVPNANIDRAIKKGTGELKGEVTASITYEAYGPGGIACIIECLTDNRNRTLSNVKSAIEKKGGKWAESGSVSFMFNRMGVIIAKGKLSDEIELELIDAGAESIVSNVPGSISIETGATHWAKVRDVLKTKGFEIQEAGLRLVAQQDVIVSDLETAKKVMAFIEAIEEDDDVSDVHTNFEISEDVEARLEE